LIDKEKDPTFLATIREVLSLVHHALYERRKKGRVFLYRYYEVFDDFDM
jgi:hypothetical protein